MSKNDKVYKIMIAIPTNVIPLVDIPNEFNFNNFQLHFEYVECLDMVKVIYRKVGGLEIKQRLVMNNTIAKISNMLVYVYCPDELNRIRDKDNLCIPFNTIKLPTNSCIEDVMINDFQLVRKTCYNYGNPTIVYKYMNEIYMLIQFRNHNVVQMIDNYIYGLSPCLLLERGIPFKTFMTNLVNPLDRDYYETISLEILRQLCNVVSFLHRNNVIHSDIRLEHIIIVNNNVKLIDFGSSFYNEHEKNEEISDCMYNKAPEQIRSTDKWTNKIDIWALGIIGISMLRKNFNIIPSNLASIAQHELSQVIRDFINVFKFERIGKIVEYFLIVNPNKRLLPQTVSRRIERENGIVNIIILLNNNFNRDEQLTLVYNEPDNFEHHFI